MSFVGAYEFTLAHEQGWYDGSHSRDPNPTLDGVTQRAYDAYRKRRNLPSRSVRDMNPAERSDIYRAYWDECDADLLPARSACAHFCFAFNAGSNRAVKLLQLTLGLTADGVVGPKTRAAVFAAEDAVLFPALRLRQLAYYREIALQKPHLRPNLLAWVGRIVDLESYRPDLAPNGGT